MPGECHVFQLEALEGLFFGQHGADLRGGPDRGHADLGLFSDHDLFELQPRHRQQRQCEGADLHRLAQPRLGRFFVRTGFQGHERNHGDRNDQEHEQHHRQLPDEVARLSFRPGPARGLRRRVDRLLPASRRVLARPFLRPRRLAALYSLLGLGIGQRFSLLAGLFLLFVAALFLFLPAGFLLGSAASAFLPLLPLPALLLLALPLLGFLHLLFLLAQGAHQGFAFLGVAALARLLFGETLEIRLAPGPFLLLAARTLLEFALGAHLGFHFGARFGLDASHALGFLAAHSLFHLPADALLRLAPGALLGLPAQRLLAAPPWGTLLGLTFCGLRGIDPGARLGLEPRFFLGLPSLALLRLAPGPVERLGLRTCLSLGLCLCRGLLARARRLGLARDFPGLRLQPFILARRL